MPKGEILPEMLAAAGVCAEFCARPEIWPAFEEWFLEEGIPANDTVSREFLLAASRILLVLIQRLEGDSLDEEYRLLASGS